MVSGVLSGVLSFWKHSSIHHPLSVRRLFFFFFLDYFFFFFFKNTTVSRQRVKNISPSALSYMRKGACVVEVCWLFSDPEHPSSDLSLELKQTPIFFQEQNKPGSEKSSQEPLLFILSQFIACGIWIEYEKWVWGNRLTVFHHVTSEIWSKKEA